MKRSLAASIVLMTAMAFTSCTCGGGTTTVVQKETCGKRFSDLKASLDSGAISKKDYDKIYARLLRECK